MEWFILLVILALPLLRLVLLLPVRVAGTMRRLPIAQITLLALLLAVAWIAFNLFSTPRESTGRYLRGEAELVKLLQ